MDEFKYSPSFYHRSASRGAFSLKGLLPLATAKFWNAPKFLTLARHVDLIDTTPLHCICVGTNHEMSLSVPHQKLLLKVSDEGALFSAVRVITASGRVCWLVVSQPDRQGFLLPLHVLNVYGNKVSSRRIKRRRMLS